ncbi:MAG: hypothetical protein WBA93_06825 [Microcoleaceae cyanobacterium]
MEIFRRINEGGTHLSGQDIRLAYYSESRTVIFIRLVGIHKYPTPVNDEDNENYEGNQKPFQRMLDLAEKQGINPPWNSFNDGR